MNKWLLICILVVTLPALASAIGPHEVLVLANDQSTDSLRVARKYAELRQVPEQNVVRVRIPKVGDAFPVEISPEDFAKLIWEPANKAAKDAGINDHILAWVYSVDFPVRITRSPDIAKISVQGFTFLRNKLPDSSVVSNGAYASPLFTGPMDAEGSAHQPQTLDAYSEWLGEDLPLPSMMLGWTGRNGNDVDTVMKCIEKGIASDCTAPSGTIYFVTSDDIRSKCRQWQFPIVQNELVHSGVKVAITPNFPKSQTDIVGIMMGADTVDPGQNSQYLPGCMAEHLTSMAGIFDSDGQTKLTAWIKAGATASAGTVVEPYAIWTKFPNAQFYANYLCGCTMIESFYQSIKCPLQIVIVGEPLAKPWATKLQITVDGLEKDTVSGKLVLHTKLKNKEADLFGRYTYLLDGKIIGNSRDFEFDTTKVPDGPHALRVVGSRTGLLRDQVFVEKKVTIKNGQQ